APARRADFDSIALPDMLPQVVPGHTIRLNFHTDSIALRRERTRERVAAKKCRAIPGPLETQDDILAGQSGWQFMAVRALHGQRHNVGGFLRDRAHSERLKSWPGRAGCRRRKPGVSAPTSALQQRLKRAAPSGGQSLDSQGAF